jgi:hypothetical protein
MHTTTERTFATPAVEDVMGVKSRISWAAILGGAVVTFASYLVLTFFAAALGLSLTDLNVSDRALLIGSVIVAVVVMAGSLFLGGWVSTQLSVGENTREAVIYGVLTWAVVTALSLGLLGMGVRAGYMALMGTTLVAQNNQQRSWEEMARDAGVRQEEINDWRAKADPNRVREEASEPANQERARQTSAIAAWSLLGGTLLSIGAAVGGALVGRGSQFRLFPRMVAVDQTTILRP